MSSVALYLPDQGRQAILAHATASAPDECCGLLALDADGRIRFVYPLTNANPSPVTFTIDPAEHFGAVKHAESNDWEIGGVFHSHPRGPAHPSMIDVRESPGPEWLYIVTDLVDVRAFRIVENSVVELQMV
ncbi:MAG: M67 family metallopeptidase [Acidimicrobiia bacterium]